MKRREILTFANALTAFRLCVAVPLLLICAVLGAHEAFVWVLGASFASDAVDGTVARLSGQSSRFGAMLDSWADVAAYTAIAIGVSVLWPELVRDAWLACGAIVASFTLPAAAGYARFGHFTSYHTWLVKLAVAAVAAALLVALWGGPHWPLGVAAVIALLAAAEEIAITCLLDAPRTDVRSLFSILRRQKHD